MARAPIVPATRRRAPPLFARGEAREPPQDEDERRRDGADEPRAGARIGEDHEKRGPGHRREKPARDAARGREGEQRDDRSATATPAADGSVNVLCARCHSAHRLERRSGSAPVFWSSADAAGEERAGEQGAVQHGGACLGHEPRGDPVHARRDEQREQGAEHARENLARVLAEDVDREGRPDAAGEEIARAEPHESRGAGDRRDRRERAKGRRSGGRRAGGCVS